MRMDRSDDEDDVLDIGDPIPRITKPEIELPPEEDLLDYISLRPKSNSINPENQIIRDKRTTEERTQPTQVNDSVLGDRGNSGKYSERSSKTVNGKIKVDQKTSKDNFRIMHNRINKQRIVTISIVSILIFSWMLMLSIQVYQMDKKLDSLNTSFSKLSSSKTTYNDSFIDPRPKIGGITLPTPLYQKINSSKTASVDGISSRGEQQQNNTRIMSKSIIEKNQTSNTLRRSGLKYQKADNILFFNTPMVTRPEIIETWRIKD